MSKFVSLENWLLEKTSGEVFNPVRNQPMEFDPRQHPELTDEFFDLINIAYQSIGGHVKVTKPSDILHHVEWNFWEGLDIHGTNDFDLVMFGQKTHYGIKFSGVGHDGEKDSKRAYLALRGKQLHELGFYAEISGKLAEILINTYNCPVLDDEEAARKVIPQNITWKGKVPGLPGDGWYTRLIAGHPHDKTVVGRPLVNTTT